MEVTLSEDVTCERECRRDELRVAYAFGGGVGSGALYVDERNESCDRAMHEFQQSERVINHHSPQYSVTGAMTWKGEGCPAGRRGCAHPRDAVRRGCALG